MSPGMLVAIWDANVTDIKSRLWILLKPNTEVTTVWLGPSCRKHFCGDLGNSNTWSFHSKIDHERILFPSCMSSLQYSSAHIYVPWRESMWSIRIYHVKWCVHDAINDAFVSFDCVVQCLVTVFHVGPTCTTFNTAKCNWPHIFRSGWINTDWWQVNAYHTLGQKFFLLIDLWIKCLRSQITEIAAKMLATERAWSNSSGMKFRHATPM